LREKNERSGSLATLSTGVEYQKGARWGFGERDNRKRGGGGHLQCHQKEGTRSRLSQMTDTWLATLGPKARLINMESHAKTRGCSADSSLDRGKKQ